MLTLRYPWDFQVKISRQSSTVSTMANNKPISECSESISPFSSLDLSEAFVAVGHSFLEARDLHLWFLLAEHCPAFFPSLAYPPLSNFKIFDIFRAIASPLSLLIYILSMPTISPFCPCKSFKEDLELINSKSISQASTSLKIYVWASSTYIFHK